MKRGWILKIVKILDDFSTAWLELNARGTSGHKNYRV